MRTARRTLLEYHPQVLLFPRKDIINKWSVHSHPSQRFDCKSNRLITSSHKQLPHQHTEHQNHNPSDGRPANRTGGPLRQSDQNTNMLPVMWEIYTLLLALSTQVSITTLCISNRIIHIRGSQATGRKKLVVREHLCEAVVLYEWISLYCGRISQTSLFQAVQLCNTQTDHFTLKRAVESKCV